MGLLLKQVGVKLNPAKERTGALTISRQTEDRRWQRSLTSTLSVVELSTASQTTFTTDL
ncbi:MAG: hypothetical protein WBA76_01160 [Phormidesmis sp.]